MNSPDPQPGPEWPRGSKLSQRTPARSPRYGPKGPAGSVSPGATGCSRGALVGGREYHRAPRRRDRGEHATNRTTGSTRATRRWRWALTACLPGAAGRRYYADVPDEQWNDWKWQLSNRVNDLETFAQILELSDEEIEGLGAPDKFRVDITPYFISLIDPSRPRRRHPPPGHAAGSRAAGLHRDDGGLAGRGSSLSGARPGPPLPRSRADAGDDAVRLVLPLLHAFADRR